jgi:Lrp/AsnC family transcriptional regulator for asnA, asnC and gidA
MQSRGTESTVGRRSAVALPAVLSDLDAVDRGIVALLQEDGRRTNASIARSVGVSESTVKHRLSRLISRGVIRIFAALSPAAVGLMADVLVGISVKPGAMFDVGEALRKMDEVVYLAYVTGRYDIFVEVLLADPDELLHFLAKRLSDVEGIVSLETLFIMRTAKASSLYLQLAEVAAS